MNKGDKEVHVIDCNSYRSVKSFNQRVRFLVLHYTAENFSSSMNALTGQSVSVHYVVPDPTDPSYTGLGFNGVRIFNLVDEDDRAWHAGVSTWDRRLNLNDTSIGIEIVYTPTEGGDGNDYVFPLYNPDQIQAVKDLCRNILQRYPNIKPTYVVGHSDIAYTRKSDPGAAFPWKDLYDAGIGAWYDLETVERYKQEFNARGLPNRYELLKKFEKYGYSIADVHEDRSFFQLTRAFQLHFRQNSYDGVMDTETAAILYALVDKYAT